MTPLRVLLVANFDRKRRARAFYNVDHKLWNGLTRAGCCVIAFSDRDVAREASLIGSSRTGAARMNRILLEVARETRPDLVLFGHADLIRPETFAALREGAPARRLAQFNVDSVERAATMAAFAARARHLDLSFLTTADPAALARLSPRPGALAYMPNPVDESVETARVWEAPRDRLAADVLFLGNGDAGREAQVAALRDALPEDVRFAAGGSIFGTGRLYGAAFLDRLASAAQSPNLALDDARPVPALYSSDRIAQLLGQGLLAHVAASAGLERLYEDGVVPFASRADLAAACIRFARDDALRRRTAERGWRLARERTNAARVARYLLGQIMETGHSEPYEWPTGRI